MTTHSSVVFNNSCIKVPVNPISKQPFPLCERRYLKEIEHKLRKLSVDSGIADSSEEKMKTKSSPEKRAAKSLIEFYDSIPEYEDMNHLSSKEFYRRLQYLKEKQRSYYDYIDTELKFETKNKDWQEDYKSLNSNKGYTCPKRKLKSSMKSYCGTPIPTKSPLGRKTEDDDSIMSSDKEVALKPPSRRSVRIETPSEKISTDNSPEPESFRPKSRANLSSAGSKRFSSPLIESPWDDLTVDEFKLDFPLETRSAPSSPSKYKLNVGWKDTITIPKPFQMTVRDEENKIIDQLMVSTKKCPEEKHELFRANPVPIESQIPLFDKIMAENERRRQKVKRKCKAALRASMRPFTFTQREEEIQELTKRLSKSSPNLYIEEEPPLKVKQFKAKPVPKNLFSNYVYKKMHEDEFYRALQRKIRAEEMLKAASLPPSMAKREKCKPKPCVCPRSYRDFGIIWDANTKSKNHFQSLDQELEELKKEFLGGSTPRQRKVKKRGDKRIKSSSTIRSKSSNRTNSAMEMDSVNRSNLAAVLRIQSARKKLEMEMAKKLEEAKLKEEARWREKVLRKRPVWQTLAFSHEEDLAMRLQLRRDEEKLRSEEHKQRMQMMLGRVNQQPTLFERQSHANNPKTREELIQSLYKEMSAYSSPNLTTNSSDSSEKRYSVAEMKDEATQSHFYESPNDDDTDIDEDTEDGAGDEKKKSGSDS